MAVIAILFLKIKWIRTSFMVFHFWATFFTFFTSISYQILNIQYIRRSAHLNSQVDNPEVGEDEGVLLDVKLHLQLEDKN